MTIDEMARLEQEHKDRIANMTKEYEDSFVKRTAEFILEKKNLSEAITNANAELKAIEAAIAANEVKRAEVEATTLAAKAHIDALTNENAEIIEKNAESARAYGEAKRQREDTIKALSEQCDIVSARIAEKERILESLDKDAEGLKAELIAKQSDASDYLARLSQNIKEAEAKAEAANAEVIVLLAKAEAATDKVKEELKVLSDLEAPIAKKKDELKGLEEKIAERTAELKKNESMFRDLDAMRSDITWKTSDLKFREEQLAKKQKALDDKEKQLNARIGG